MTESGFETFVFPLDQRPGFDSDRWFRGLPVPQRIGGGFTGETEEPWPRRLLAAKAKNDLFRGLEAAVGSTAYLNTTLLPLLGGGSIKAVMADGKVLMWSFWFPHRRALFDNFFQKKMPSQAEMDARVSFALDNGLKYAFTEPGWRATIDDIKQWLDRET